MKFIRKSSVLVNLYVDGEVIYTTDEHPFCTPFMNNQIITDPYFIKLQFSHEWIDIGIININSFTAIKEEYLKGEDENTEHYRWNAFRSFMQHNNFLSPEKFYMLYKIGKNDPDLSMGRAIIFDIIKRQDSPEILIDMAVNDNDITLSRYALKYKNIRMNKMI